MSSNGAARSDLMDNETLVVFVHELQVAASILVFPLANTILSLQWKPPRGARICVDMQC